MARHALAGVRVVRLIYLAPEIPALSATFVYNELLALEKLGHHILPVSVHYPKSVATDAHLSTLKSKTTYLYDTSKVLLLSKHLSFLLGSPLPYIKTVLQCLGDMFTFGLLSRKSLGLFYRFYYSVQLADLVKKTNTSHIHVHFAHVPTDIAMYASKLANISFSVMAHANDIFERGILLDKKVRRAAFFATISDFNRTFIKSKFNISLDDIKIIRCGVDETVFKTKQRNNKQSNIKIGVIGRLVEKKGIDTLIEAFSLLDKQKKYELVIAGSGPLKEQLETQVLQLGLVDKVKFLGALGHEKVVDFLTEIDLFVLPCKVDQNGDMDGIPVVLMEAMMVGTPVISSNISGIPELVIHQQTGLLVEPEQPKHLAETISMLVDDKPLQEKITKQAIKHVSTEFSQSVNANRLDSLCKSINLSVE